MEEKDHYKYRYCRFELCHVGDIPVFVQIHTRLLSALRGIDQGRKLTDAVFKTASKTYFQVPFLS
jgi:hypothetical protein